MSEPLYTLPKHLRNLADNWYYCGRCGYVAFEFPEREMEGEWTIDDCPKCGERWWLCVVGLGRTEREAIIRRELPRRSAAALEPVSRGECA